MRSTTSRHAPPDPALPFVQTIVQRMTGELDRFQRERAHEIGLVLRDFALAQAQVSGDAAAVWITLVPALEAGEGGA